MIIIQTLLQRHAAHPSFSFLELCLRKSMLGLTSDAMLHTLGEEGCSLSLRHLQVEGKRQSQSDTAKFNLHYYRNYSSVTKIEKMESTRSISVRWPSRKRFCNSYLYLLLSFPRSTYSVYHTLFFFFLCLCLTRSLTLIRLVV